MPRPAAVVLKQLREGVAKGWKSGLTVLTGEDGYHLDAAQAALLSHLAPDDDSGYALTVFGEGSADVADVVAAARSKAMFAPRRVVFVREGESLDGKPEALLAYAADPPDDSFLIVRAPKLDLRRPLHKALLKAGTVVELAIAKDPSMGRTVVRLAAERNLRLDAAVVALVEEVCAGDLYRVTAELDKLDAFMGPGAERRVSLEDARAIVFGGGALSGWEIANAILERDLASALTAVRNLVAAGEEPIRLIGGMAWRCRTLLQAKAMLAGGASPQRALAAARGGNRQEFAKALSRYTLEELMSFPSRLLEADRCLKSRALDPLAVMESLVRDLIRPSWATEQP